MPKYTTEENIARKLRGRLRIENQPEVNTNLQTILGYGNSASGQTVDNDLIEQLFDQTDAYIDLVLSQIYEYELKLTSNVTVKILEQLSEDLIISKLISVHFQGTNPVLPTADVAGAVAADRHLHGLSSCWAR